MIEIGQGATLDFVAWMGDRYIDLAQELTRGQSSYSDFEGMAGPEFTEHMMANDEIRKALEGGEPFMRDLTAHWLYENDDQAGLHPTVGETLNFILTLQWLFTSRFYLKVDAE